MSSWGSSVPVSDVNSLKQQDAAAGNPERTEPGWRSERTPYGGDIPGGDALTRGNTTAPRGHFQSREMASNCEVSMLPGVKVAAPIHNCPLGTPHDSRQCGGVILLLREYSRSCRSVSACRWNRQGKGGRVHRNPNNMQTVKLRSGNEMPVIGLGTWQLTGEQCVTSVSEALQMGYRHIDTASGYSNHREVSAGIKASGVKREDIFVTSKVWRESLRYDDLIAECNQTLAELDTDYLDLYLIHWPNKDIPMTETFRALEKVHKDGKVRDIGVSNFTIAHVVEAIEASSVPISMNQVEYHAHLNQEDLLSECRKRGVLLTAYSPLGRGTVLKDETITSIAAGHGKEPSQVALRWLIQKGIVVIPKASSAEHIRSNFNIFDFELTADEMQQIDNIPVHQRLIDPDFGEFDRQ